MRAATAVLVALAVALGAGAGLALSSTAPERSAAAAPPAPPSEAVAGAAAAAGAPVPAPPRGRTYWGAFRRGVPYDPGVVDSLARLAGRRPAIAMWFQEWGPASVFPVAGARELRRRGIVPMVSWEPWVPGRGPDQPDFALRRIVAGAFDDHIRRYAEGIREHGGPVMLRPFHEMDGNWYPWGGTVNGNTPADFRAAWRHVHDVVEAAGATNVTWVWSVNHMSVPEVPENAIHRYWPGGQYVDWLGVSGFSGGVRQWTRPIELFGSRVPELRRYRRPIAIAEVAATEADGPKPAWTRELFTTLRRRLPRVAAFVWLDRFESTARDWRIDSSRRTLAEFRRGIRARRVLSAPAAARRR
jgi:hypothetical protein